eukprot:1139476-Pelagomonas_calceolata.AAC.2
MVRSDGAQQPLLARSNGLQRWCTATTDVARSNDLQQPRLARISAQHPFGARIAALRQEPAKQQAAYHQCLHRGQSTACSARNGISVRTPAVLAGIEASNCGAMDSWIGPFCKGAPDISSQGLAQQGQALTYTAGPLQSKSRIARRCFMV